MIRLRCINPAAARDCATFLANHGMGLAVGTRGEYVVVPEMTERSIRNLLEDAAEHGWADEDARAELIAEMETNR